MKSGITFDTSEFEKALKKFAAESRKQGHQVLMGQAKLFVRDAVGVTPPNKGAKISKKIGEATVRGDLAKIMTGTRRATDVLPQVIHRRFRDRRGRVRKDLRSDKKDSRYRVGRAELRAYQQLRLGKVGFLAAGWNAAAAKLGTRLPAWITRHGTRFGSIEITLNDRGMFIRIANAVPYVGNISGLERRIQWALDNRALQMTKQLENLAVKRAARAAGFK